MFFSRSPVHVHPGPSQKHSLEPTPNTVRAARRSPRGAALCLYYSCFTAQKAVGRATAGVRPGSSRLLLCVLRCCTRSRVTPRAKMAGAAWTASSRLRGFTGRKWPLALAPRLSSEKQHFLISNSTRHSVCPAKTK